MHQIPFLLAFPESSFRIKVSVFIFPVNKHHGVALNQAICGDLFTRLTLLNLTNPAASLQLQVCATSVPHHSRI